MCFILNFREIIDYKMINAKRKVNGNFDKP